MTGLRTATAALLALGTPAFATAQAAPATFELTIPSIMRGPELVGTPPAAVRWTDDGRWVYFRWKPGGRPWHEDAGLYRVAAAGGTPERISASAADSLGVYTANGPVSLDERRRAVSWMGDLWIIERATGVARRLTHTRASESTPAWSRDGRSVYFVRDNNLYAIDLAGASIRQLTDIRSGPKPEEPREATGQRKTLEEQQLELFEHIRLEKARRDSAEARRKAREARELKTVWLGQGERLFRIAVEPDARYAVVEVGREASGARGTIMPDWITASGYTEPVTVRSKVGDQQNEGRMGLISLATGEATWLDLAPAPRDSARKGAERLASATFGGWNADGTRGLITAVSYDFKDRWIYVLDAATAKLTRVSHERNDAWLDGPCFDGCVGWMPDGRAVWYVSERDGYAHLYTVRADGTGTRQLTEGRFEVHDVRIAPDDSRFYLTTNEGSPYEQHFWHMALAGGARTRITGAGGFNAVEVSPDGRRMAVVHSASNRPPELYLAEHRVGAEMRRVTTSPTAAWSSYRWIDPEIVEFTARDSVKVPARIYRPRDVGAEPNGGGVIFVHGAGYLQNVHRGWSTYFREYMFHHLLASQGFTVLDVDYRGSAGYGRDWRTAVYRHMGGKDLDDITDGAKHLAAAEGVDPARIGLYGGSYGGFITLMALFTEAETFAAGAALR